MTAMTDAPPEPAAEAPASPASLGRAGGVMVVIGLNDATVQRIRDTSSFDLSTDETQLGSAAIVALSTRTARGQIARMPEGVDPETTPIVVVCHPGGEETAVQLMRSGCAGVVAEGNERAIGSFVDPETHTDLLVEGFLEQQDNGGGGGGNRHHDPVTSLPDVSVFEVRLGELVEEGSPPNVVMMQITNLEKVRERTDSRAINLLRRRLASFYSDAARRSSCEAFSLSEARFAVIDGSQLLLDPEGFASDLIEITEAFRPAGIKLQLAVGAVIGSGEADVLGIRDQAEQAVMAAAQTGGSAYVTADEVTILMASSTEYHVAQLLVSQVDEQVANPSGHSARVADLAADMAQELGFQGRDLTSLRLAALLHEVGRIPQAAVDGAADEEYPERGARYVQASAGPEIADAIRYHTERWDGAGPGALVEDDIPLNARVIAIAKAADTWLHPPAGETALEPSELIDKIKADAGSRFDPTLVETAIRLFGGA